MTNFALQSHEIYRKLVAVVNIIPKTYRTAWMYLESSIGTNVTDTAESESNSPVELNEMLKTSTISYPQLMKNSVLMICYT